MTSGRAPHVRPAPRLRFAGGRDARRPPGRRIGWLVAATLLGPPAPAAEAPAPGLRGDYRLSVARVAPWVPAERAAEARARIPLLQGRDVRFESDAVVSPSPLACNPAAYHELRVPAEGLFQGGLPQPAADARGLGLPDGHVATVRVTCANAAYDVHATGDGQWLVALDDLVWTLDRSPGARALPDRPEHVVQLAVEAHLLGGAGFDRAGIGRLKSRASAGLRALLDAALAAGARSSNEPESLPADPITDSRQAPARVSVGRARIVAGRAEVPVRWILGPGHRDVRFVLMREGEAWRIDDVRHADGGTLRTLLTTLAGAGAD